MIAITVVPSLADNHTIDSPVSSGIGVMHGDRMTWRQVTVIVPRAMLINEPHSVVLTSHGVLVSPNAETELIAVKAQERAVVLIRERRGR